MDNQKVNPRKSLLSIKNVFIISLIYIIVANVIYMTIVINNAPSGGLDMIASAIVYVFIWQLLIWIPPILLLVASIVIWLYKYHKKAFQITMSLLVIIIAVVVLYFTIGKKLIYTPSFVVSRTKHFSEYMDKRNNYEKSSLTEHDNICSYVHYLAENAVRNIPQKVPSEETKKQYITAVMDARWQEIPNAVGYMYIPSIKDIVGIESESVSTLSNKALEKLSEYAGASWNTEHSSNQYKTHLPIIFEGTENLILVLYNDGTMDPASAVYPYVDDI